MAGNWPTMVDVASRSIDGKQVVIAEMLSQATALYADLPIVESSEQFGHEFVWRTSLPTGVWRQFNQGAPTHRTTTAKGRIGLAELVDYSQVDKSLAERSGDVERFRENEDIGFLEGMGQTLEQTAIYGNTVVNPAQMMGLSSFYYTVSTATAAQAANVMDGGGTGSSNSSMWLLGLGERAIYGIAPKGSAAGLVMEDKGDTVPAYDSLGNRFEAYTSYFRAISGVVPQDWRYGVRIANLDVTSAGLAGTTPYDLFAGLSAATLRVPAMGRAQSGITQTDSPYDSSLGVRWQIVVNRTVRHWMDVQAMRNKNVLLQLQDYAGIVVDHFRPGLPVRVSDQLTTTEARVV